MSIWLQERVVERLRELAGQGQSATRIAQALTDQFGGSGFSVTRNAVIGKCTRIGVPLTGAPSIHTGERQPKLSKAPKAASARSAPLIRPFLGPLLPPGEREEMPAILPRDDTAGPSAKGLLDLRDRQCRWPVSGGLFCAEPVSAENPTWCPGHRLRAIDVARTARVRRRQEAAATHIVAKVAA